MNMKNNSNFGAHNLQKLAKGPKKFVKNGRVNGLLNVKRSRNAKLRANQYLNPRLFLALNHP
ncbi:hypothetical protein AGABI1DRAFT_100746 [Agaricus bisporus var. burnettii JB137-S8]|uniref:Uncharacterized protein n=1 Tax=Agaricus bisporus var. burnettii (strain JB137-S8 / ATCC MYA-4627 / FGSC 10392) TaxID=597362 RepID=K5XUF0_AGABU|nr:uncharacterized protein AGABI1DRAFT_100746 [Agaricus bisporus var. burnettii JB137-S8]EKM78710.1 hypothetical protein AGABI1DRAFT_100746 [Agaricus bisporus var. burnettii JB137-S8]